MPSSSLSIDLLVQDWLPTVLNPAEEGHTMSDLRRADTVFPVPKLQPHSPGWEVGGCSQQFAGWRQTMLQGNMPLYSSQMGNSIMLTLCSLPSGSPAFSVSDYFKCIKWHDYLIISMGFLVFVWGVLFYFVFVWQCGSIKHCKVFFWLTNWSIPA